MSPQQLSMFEPSGPQVKLFESMDAFTGYVQECRRILGDEQVGFRTPFLAVGVFL